MPTFCRVHLGSVNSVYSAYNYVCLLLHVSVKYCRIGIRYRCKVALLYYVQVTYTSASGGGHMYLYLVSCYSRMIIKYGLKR